MKRAGPLARRFPLRTSPETTLAWKDRSSGALPSKSSKRRSTDKATAALRAEIAARPCLLARVGFVPDGHGGWSGLSRCAGPGTPHHLQKSSAAGQTIELNLVPLCAAHNGWVEDEPAKARLIGLVVRPGITHAEALALRVAAGLE